MPLDALIAPQRGHLFPWIPVLLAVGIGVYFILPVEPAPRLMLGVALVAILVALISLRVPESLGPVVLAIALVLGGMSLAAWRAQDVAAPVLAFRYYGAIEGRIIEIDRSQSDKVRLTLDRVVLSDTSPDRTPATVRVSLHGSRQPVPLEPGLLVILTGHLSPPMGPSEPGGFDFRRLAWFERLGAVGYSRTPVLALEPLNRDGPFLWIAAYRGRLADAIRARMSGQSGAFAAAVVTGDRSALERATMDAMRFSNLAHLLAISGLHMGLLTSVVFLLVRLAVALVPWLALRVDGRKCAAIVALIAAACYLALSGGSVATQRAFMMAAVMLGAVLLDRRALTLRAVALAAVIILVLRPEALLNVGFQMSFAATTALVWVFSQMRDTGLWQSPRWLRPVATLVLSSAVAGIATAPIGAAHFNQIAQFGLIANLLAVPVMGAVVMPAAVLAACLAPFGLASVGLWLMGLGCRWILLVAHHVSSLDAALRPIAAPDARVLPILGAGCLFVILWQGRWRWLGLGPVCLALGIWTQSARPPLLIADTGTMVGVLSDAGRVLNKPRGDGFAARAWLENDGDRRAQDEAARPGKHSFDADLGGLRLRQMTASQTRKHPDPCAGVDLLITPEIPQAAPGCQVIDLEVLRETGALALWPTDEGLRVVTAAQRSGVRYWTSAAIRNGSPRAGIADDHWSIPRKPGGDFLAWRRQ